ncbi:MULTISPECIES: right-handed parallel beta-helix repeat-containing protein [Niastella]|uniref:Right-handed parallel beta-helix repeat-containing protein n=1 Tax=Niastella soli TaxID=2821487 RepID=A0ABS3Z5Q1_9BACT|nr:right-handed parallel beta-helix repeat-containing protein [Niastella soli]MBO9205472.1 right-handed parallel beta-helix repeat-containing protein [Niastella soli]
MRNILMLSVLLFCFSCKKDTAENTADDPKTPDSGVNGAQNSLPAYYVDGAGGNDKNDGLTLATAWKTIQKSFDAAVAGSTVMIKGGTYFEQLAVHVSGTAGNPVTFTNYNNEQVIIEGSKISGTTILTITDKSFLIFRNLTIQNITKNNAVGILVSASKSGGVSDLIFRNVVLKNINWTSNASTKPNSNQNSQPFIAFGYGAAQANAITNLVIDSCEFTGNITGYSEALSLDGNIDGFVITNNKVHDNANIGIAAIGHYGVSSNSALDQSRNGLISGNLCFNNKASYATSGGIYVDGGKDIKIDRNISYQNGYGIEIGNEENGTASNITVTNNLIYQNEVTGIAIGGYDDNTTGQVTNCTIRNNSFLKNNTNNDGSGEFYITKASNCTIGNNVFYTNSQNTLFSLENISPQTGNVIDYNNWFTQTGNASDITINWRATSYGSFSDYKTKTGQDAHSYFKDPLFTGIGATPDLHVKIGSPCLRTGNVSWITDATEKDLDGKPRVVNGAVDMGAYQQQ